MAGISSKHIFRADHVGSFVRPGRLIEAARAHRAGTLSADDFREIQDQCIAEIAAFHGGTRSFDPKGPGTHVGLFVEADPISGYVNTEHSKALQGRAYLSVEGRGRGAFVLFADDPNFRGAWRGLTRLFLNATLLMPSKHLKN